MRKGYYYEDAGFEILLVPGIFAVEICPGRKKVIFDYNKFGDYLKDIIKIRKENGTLEEFVVDELDIKVLQSIVSSGNLEGAENYCIKYFERTVEDLGEELEECEDDEDEFNPNLGYDTDGFDG